MTNTLLEPELDQHLRRTLRAVAATIEDEPTAATRKRRPSRRTLVSLGAVAVAVPLAAGAIIGIGPEYVDTIPPDNVIVADSLDGIRYWVVESFHTDECDNPLAGVEIVIEEDNIIGRSGKPQASGTANSVADAGTTSRTPSPTPPCHTPAGCSSAMRSCGQELFTPTSPQWKRPLTAPGKKSRSSSG